jgi:UDP-N-acetylmuramate: L-alanyl-gamma-D-glutamyl-meso-diaminopimelate ligase
MRAHLVGICGTAMAGVGILLKEAGMEVTGSDTASYPPMSTLLASKGIGILPGWNPDNVGTAVSPAAIDPRLSNAESGGPSTNCGIPAPSRPDIVVVGNVARRDNPEVLRAQELGVPLISMPQAIERHFLPGRQSIVITGTHGKTTVTSCTAWLLSHAGRDPGFLVGGIPLNFGRNAYLGRGHDFVIEGDEYDTAFFDKKAKFFHYNPSLAVMTSLEFDHADIYPDLAKLVSTFKEFADLVPPFGTLFYCADYPILAEVATACPGHVVSYGTVPQAQVRITDIAVGPAGTRFKLTLPGGTAHDVGLPMWGEHNALNATAAALLARQAGVSMPDILAGLATFQGVKRRFETLAQVNEVTVIDDFAHHPTAVRATLSAARTRFPDRRIFAAFHFESNTSRRKVFEAEYAQAFRGADHVFLTFPLKKNDSLKPEDYLDPNAVLAGIRTYAATCQAFEDMGAMGTSLASELRPGDVVVGMSGRDFGPMYKVLLEKLAQD